MSAQAWIIVVVVVMAAFLFTGCSRKRVSQADHAAPSEGNAPREEIDQAISDWVQRRVREGFETREEIIEGVTDIIEDEYEANDVKVLVTKETDRLLDEHLRSQSSWPKRTDCDTIDAAFAALEGKGIVARQNFSCCQTCGNAEIGDEIKEFAKRSEPKGYTYYHMQDTEGACEDGALCLAYGTVGGTDEDAVSIGEIIRDTLTQHGLTVEWNGDIGKRIVITGIDWKKRRTKE